MNYRHGFHAGNFADCMKHALLLALLRGLMRKSGPLFVLDTHAGAGQYDLASDAAARTNEAADGVFRILDRTPDALADYAGMVRLAPKSSSPGSVSRRCWSDPPDKPGDDVEGAVPRVCPGDRASLSDGWYQHGAVTDPPIRPGDGDEVGERPRDDRPSAVRHFYPGSPLLIRALLRADDHLACCELHPDEHAALRALFRRDPQVSVHCRDGWEALKALLPPRQKRGLVLIDPPYEDPREFSRLAEALTLAHARFPSAVLAAWYPIKHRAPVRALFGSLTAPDSIAAELLLREPLDAGRLNGCGLVVVNPPWQFETEAQPILTALLACLGRREAGEGTAIVRLTHE